MCVMCCWLSSISNLCLQMCQQKRNCWLPPILENSQQHTQTALNTWSLFSSAVVWPPSCLYNDIMVCVSQTTPAELVEADVDTVTDTDLWSLCTLYCSSYSNTLNFLNCDVCRGWKSSNLGFTYVITSDLETLQEDLGSWLILLCLTGFATRLIRNEKLTLALFLKYWREITLK